MYHCKLILHSIASLALCLKDSVRLNLIFGVGWISTTQCRGLPCREECPFKVQDILTTAGAEEEEVEAEVPITGMIRILTKILKEIKMVEIGTKRYFSSMSRNFRGLKFWLLLLEMMLPMVAGEMSGQILGWEKDPQPQREDQGDLIHLPIPRQG
jgi:hypothetical protein